MAVYAIGDIQGCQTALEQLLRKISFDQQADKLWLTGDLVNRGPDSLRTLRFIRELGDSAVCVLGNHDLHLLAVDAGQATAKKRDTLDAILSAPDRNELIAWLRHRPLAVHDRDFLMVHAGVLPQWDVRQTIACAAEVEAVLRGPDYRDFLGHMYGDEPSRWDDKLTGNDRLRCIVNGLTRLRFCRADGTMCQDAKGPPGSQPAGYLPWFEVPGRATASTSIVFGHWSTLGSLTDTGRYPSVFPLDTGCVWGGNLTALRVDRPSERISVSCEQQQPVLAR